MFCWYYELAVHCVHWWQRWCNLGLVGFHVPVLFLCLNQGFCKYMNCLGIFFYSLIAELIRSDNPSIFLTLLNCAIPWSSLFALALLVNLESVILSTSQSNGICTLYNIPEDMLCIWTCQETLYLSLPPEFSSSVTYPVINSIDIRSFYQFSKTFFPEFFQVFYYLEKYKYVFDILSFVPAFYIEFI